MGLSSWHALASASSPHGYQSTGLSACWRRYGLVSWARRFTCPVFQAAAPPRGSIRPMSLPSGTVTFVFTDVEGSTRLLHQLRDRYGEVVAAQRRLVRDAFQIRGGREVDTQGDAFFYAFPRARDAVAAAV